MILGQFSTGNKNLQSDQRSEHGNPVYCQLASCEVVHCRRFRNTKSTGKIVSQSYEKLHISSRSLGLPIAERTSPIRAREVTLRKQAQPTGQRVPPNRPITLGQAERERAQGWQAQGGRPDISGGRPARHLLRGRAEGARGGPALPASASPSATALLISGCTRTGSIVFLIWSRLPGRTEQLC